MSSNIVRFDRLRSVSGTLLTSSYTAFGAGFSHAMRVLHFTNDTNSLIYISFDGVNDNIVLIASQSFALYDLTSDEDYDERFRYQNNTQLYIKYVGSAPSPVTGTSNTVYAVAVYGKGE